MLDEITSGEDFVDRSYIEWYIDATAIEKAPDANRLVDKASRKTENKRAISNLRTKLNYFMVIIFHDRAFFSLIQYSFFRFFDAAIK